MSKDSDVWVTLGVQRELLDALERMKNDIVAKNADLAAARVRVERLEAALAWYADKQNWWSSDYGDDGIWQDTWRPDKDGKRPEHGFERARAALEVQP